MYKNGSTVTRRGEYRGTIRYNPGKQPILVSVL